MKNFTVDDELEKILEKIGKTFGHKDIYETIFNGFLFLRFLEDIHVNNNELFLHYNDGKIIKLPVSELLSQNVEKEEELPKSTELETKKRTNKKKTEKKTKIIR